MLCSSLYASWIARGDRSRRVRPDRLGLLVGVHQHRPLMWRAARPIVWISDVRPGGSLLVGVEDRDERDLGQVESSRSRLTPTSVVFAQPQLADDLNTLGVSISECRYAPSRPTRAGSRSGPRHLSSASSRARARRPLRADGSRRVGRRSDSSSAELESGRRHRSGGSAGSATVSSPLLVGPGVAETNTSATFARTRRAQWRLSSAAVAGSRSRRASAARPVASYMPPICGTDWCDRR